MKELTDICRVTVKFSEIDSMRRAWHGSYVTYFEDGRESFGRHYPGIGYADMQREGIYAPMYDMHLRYFAPLEINDVAEIHTRYVRYTLTTCPNWVPASTMNTRSIASVIMCSVHQAAARNSSSTLTAC